VNDQSGDDEVGSKRSSELVVISRRPIYKLMDSALTQRKKNLCSFYVDISTCTLCNNV
jgi:hypothetical protein